MKKKDVALRDTQKKEKVKDEQDKKYEKPRVTRIRRIVGAGGHKN